MALENLIAFETALAESKLKNSARLKSEGLSITSEREDFMGGFFSFDWEKRLRSQKVVPKDKKIKDNPKKIE